MKEIPLSRGYVALVDDEDYERVNKLKWHASPQKRADGTLRVYAVHSGHRMNGKQIKFRLHRFILDTPKDMVVDHIDGNPLNNSRGNIRICSHAENGFNRRIQSGGKSRFKGVVWNRKRRKWEAQIWFNGRRRYLGVYICEEDAARAYDVAAEKMFGAFSRPNNYLGMD